MRPNQEIRWRFQQANRDHIEANNGLKFYRKEIHIGKLFKLKAF